ncbi:MAG: hypothetical protein Q7V88_15235 [Actinomycetota bacterium]|nr:hypothetical protein [Actinomycetota bacterium]
MPPEAIVRLWPNAAVTAQVCAALMTRYLLAAAADTCLVATALPTMVAKWRAA